MAASIPGHVLQYFGVESMDYEEDKLQAWDRFLDPRQPSLEVLKVSTCFIMMFVGVDGSPRHQARPTLQTHHPTT